MKKILFLLFSVSLQVFSQNNTFPSNGNVGIGTISPIQKLEVRKDSATITSILVRNTSATVGAFAQYQAIGSAGKGVWLGIVNDGNAGLGTFQSGYSYLSSNNLSSGLNIGADASSGVLRFFTGGTGVSNERMRISSNGNIGIGTTTPTNKLEIIDNIGVTFRSSQIPNTAQSFRIFGGAYSGNKTSLIINNSTATDNFLQLGGGTSLAEPASKILFFTGSVGTTSLGVERLRIDNNGNVGIGTVSPTQKLDIVGNGMKITNPSSSAYFYLEGNGSTNYAGSYIFMKAAATKTTDTFNQVRFDVNRGTDSTANFQISRSKDGVYQGYFYRYDDLGGHRFLTVANRHATNTSEVLTIRPNGNVGVGTANPLAKLEIGGSYAQSTPLIAARSSNGNDIEFGHQNQAGYISVLGHNASNGYPFLAFNAEAGTSVNTFKTRGKIGRVIYSDLAGGLRVGVIPNANADNQVIIDDFYINNIGNIGMGTTNPTEKLEVANITEGGRVLLSDNGGVNRFGLLLQSPTSTKNYARVLGYKWGENAGVNLVLNDQGGNVGIGTITPKNTLDLGSGTNNRGISWGGTNNNYSNIWTKYSNGNLIIATGLAPLDNSSGFASSYTPATMGKAAIELGAFVNGGDIMFYGNAPASIPVGQSYTPTERMRIKSSGQVLIGTSTPYLDYKLAVAGNIIADKVKVKKSTNGVWPDFVFSPSYKLPNLSEIESFVKQNSHLPEIPSAAEIEKEGQDLGEMNRLLLKKVEELTLYLIEQSKEIKTLKSKVELLEKK